jgi:hypothetical protein
MQVILIIDEVYIPNSIPLTSVKDSFNIRREVCWKRSLFAAFFPAIPFRSLLFVSVTTMSRPIRYQTLRSPYMQGLKCRLHWFSREVVATGA